MSSTRALAEPVALNICAYPFASATRPQQAAATQDGWNLAPLHRQSEETWYAYPQEDGGTDYDALRAQATIYPAIPTGFPGTATLHLAWYDPDNEYGNLPVTPPENDGHDQRDNAATLSVETSTLTFGPGEAVKTSYHRIADPRFADNFRVAAHPNSGVELSYEFRDDASGGAGLAVERMRDTSSGGGTQWESEWTLLSDEYRTGAAHIMPTINLTIKDGAGGSFVEDDEETTRGAFTVANLNDTDGDGIIDNVDDDVTATANGEDEVDLMRLIISKPKLSDGGNVVLQVNPTSRVRIWADYRKRTEIALDQNGCFSFATTELPKIVHIEATQPSTSIGDIQIAAHYTPPGSTHTAWDWVTATAVWASVTAVQDDTSDAIAVKNAFPDMDGPPLTALEAVGGTGLRPLSPTRGMENAIAIQFTIQPSVDSFPDDVYFDIARRGDLSLIYWKNNVMDPGSPHFEPYPIMLDEANDDPNETDESATPNTAGHMYSFDSPGFLNAQLGDPRIDQASFQMNALEYMRFGAGGDPAGNGLNGSLMSSFYQWHVVHSIQKTAGVWNRTTGDAQEVCGSNCIGPGEYPT